MILVDRYKRMVSTNGLKELHDFAVREVGIKKAMGLFKKQSKEHAFPHYAIDTDGRLQRAVRAGARKVERSELNKKAYRARKKKPVSKKSKGQRVKK